MAKTGNFIEIPVNIKTDANNVITEYYRVPEHDDPIEQQEQIRKKLLILAGNYTLGES